MANQKGSKISNILFPFDNFDEQSFDISYFRMSRKAAFSWLR
jgi:hypothetical protein